MSKKKLTKAEKETWDILNTPPPTPRELMEEQIGREMAQQIRKEIDEEILAELRKQAQQQSDKL